MQDCLAIAIVLSHIYIFTGLQQPMLPSLSTPNQLHPADVRKASCKASHGLALHVRNRFKDPYLGANMLQQQVAVQEGPCPGSDTTGKKTYGVWQDASYSPDTQGTLYMFRTLAR